MNHHQIKSGLWASVVAGILTAALVSCESKNAGEEKDDSVKADTDTDKGSTTGTKVTADNPADSTGVLAAVSLGFSRLIHASGLALQTGTTVDAGGGVILSDARISIGSIKIKANKEMDESEKGMKQGLEDEKKARETAMEAGKKALEQEKEAVEAKYEPQFEGIEDAEKDALKAHMKAEQAVVEEKIAALESKKEGELDALEQQRDDNLKWPGPYVYSLIDNSVTPAIPEIQLVDGSYKRIEFEIKPNRTLGGTDPLLNNAIYLAGTAMVNGTATPFTASFRVDEEFKLMGTGALKVDPTATNALTVAFNPTAWFSMVDFTAAILDATGTVVVSKDSNPAIWKLIRENIKRSTKFGEDKDGDGELKENETEGDGDEGVESEDESASEVEGDESLDEEKDEVETEG